MKEEKEGKKERKREKAKFRTVINTDFGISITLIFHFIYAVVNGLEVRFSTEAEISLFLRRRASGQSTVYGEDKAAGT
jgi:hypothetical protein